MNELSFYNDLEKILNVMPKIITDNINQQELNDLTEIVLDLGRVPEMRFSTGEIKYLSDKLVTPDDIKYVIDRIEDFTSDNRSGVAGTLHRISAIKNRKGKIIGLTARIGRVVTGTILCISDIVKDGKSILFLGRPGVGKTTKLREIARMVADELGKRVVVVDTSNEIAGDGDIPHRAIGKARRMQVPSPEMQKDIMIEAVENHTPQVIVVDEIGTEEEALAARTIAERGVMLIATAHGNMLENLIKNPTLSDLVGGVSSVTLGDDEARRRATQKTILEREKQPTFDVVMEIVDRETLAVYPDVATAVDYILRGWPIQPEIRKTGYSPTEKTGIEPKIALTNEEPIKKTPEYTSTLNRDFNVQKYVDDNKQYRKIYVYSISRTIVEKAIERLNLNAKVTKNIDDADIVISHKSYAKGGSKIIEAAQEFKLPIHFVKSNNMPQIQKALKLALGVKSDDENTQYHDETDEALEEAQKAVLEFLENDTEVELAPRKAEIRKLQHEYIEQHNLKSISIGEEPNRRLKITK
ncbi:MAG: AAA family ATPase [Candidatus Gastranaerophilales bacterium]|nr:AAA family ATPase [Candidatus Gastranaerophilales bacterium]